MEDEINAFYEIRRPRYVPFPLRSSSRIFNFQHSIVAATRSRNGYKKLETCLSTTLSSNALDTRASSLPLPRLRASNECPNAHLH